MNISEGLFFLCAHGRCMSSV